MKTAFAVCLALALTLVLATPAMAGDAAPAAAARGYRGATPCTPPDLIDLDRAVKSARANCTTFRMPSTPCDPCPCMKGYLGVHLAVFPGVGGGLEYGRYFKYTGGAKWSWEIGATWQDLTDGFNGNDGVGTFLSGTVGVKAALWPKRRQHLTIRAGLGYAHLTDAAPNLDIGDFDDGGAGDYVGGYVGLGWEWDLFACCVTTGPEVRFFAGLDTSDSEWGYALTALWHVDFNF